MVPAMYGFGEGGSKRTLQSHIPQAPPFFLARNQSKSGDIGLSLLLPDSAGIKTGRRSQCVLATGQ